MTSVLSIVHRGTGLIITAGALIIAGWLWSIALGEQSYSVVHFLLASKVGKGFMVIWTWCTSYHLLNGIRHLIWDMGYGYEIPDAYTMGWLVLAGSVMITGLVWLL